MAKFFTPTKLSENIRETPEGFLLCLNVPIARTGWQDYGKDETPLEAGANGLVKVHREAKEVFRPQTIASFNGKPVTIKHPEEFVAPDNWQYLAKGIAQNVRRGDEKDEDGEEILFADLLITDAMAIQLVNNGLREISCGYEAEYEQTGEGEGRQFNIVGNHIALVEQGRAGSTYAIQDSNERVIVMKKFKELAEKLTALGKTIDETMKEDAPKAKDADEEQKAKDADEEKAKDAAMYDELIKMVKDLGSKIESMAKPKDEASAEKKDDEKAKDEDEEKSKDADEEEKQEDSDEEEMKIEERLKAVEAAIAKLLEMEESEASDDDEEMSGAEDEDEEESESEDADEEAEKKEKVGDEALAEILAPGIKIAKGEDLQAKALKAAYTTDEGKEVIHQITGGKKPTFDSKEHVAMVFRASAVLLKQKRGTGLEKTKDGKQFIDDDNKVEAPVTAEKLNEINAQFWANRK